jgi:hypothetical protein
MRTSHGPRGARAPTVVVYLVALLFAVLLGACGSKSTAEEAPPPAHPEAVVVSLTGDSGKPGQTCAGTLVSSNVVVTAAHCAEASDKGVVRAPGANNAKAKIARVYTYNWVPGDSPANQALGDDVALLVLRTEIKLPRYGKLQRGACDACAVVSAGGQPTHLARAIPKDHPRTRFLKSTGVPSGRALYVTGKGAPVLAGISVGTGSKSRGTYIAPLNRPGLQGWIGDVVRSAAPKKAPAATGIQPRTLHILDEESGDDDDNAGSSGDDDDVVSGDDDDSANNGGDDDDSANNGGDDDDDSANNGGDDDDDGADATPTDGEDIEPSQENTGDDDDDNGNNGNGDDDDNGNNNGNGDDDDNGNGNGDDDGNGTSDPNDPQVRGSIPGVAPLGEPQSTEQTTVHPSGNSVTVAKPGDKAFSDDQAIAQNYEGVANIYNSHGAPGQLIGTVPEDQVRQFLQDDKPLIVASCFSAARLSGGSSIRRMVSEYGTADDASRVYGCSGYASASSAQGFGCTGAWLDANGTAVSDDERQRLGLHQMRCNINTLDDTNRPSWDDCQATD